MIILSVVLYSFLLVKLRFKAKITSGTLANMCNYVRFYAYVAWMITLLCMIWRLIVPLIKMFLPSNTSLRIAGFKLWHQMMILIDHLRVRRMICKIQFLIDHVFFIIIAIVIVIFLFAIMTFKYKKRKKYRKHTKRERGQKEKKNKIK